MAGPTKHFAFMGRRPTALILITILYALTNHVPSHSSVYRRMACLSPIKRIVDVGPGKCGCI